MPFGSYQQSAQQAYEKCGPADGSRRTDGQAQGGCWLAPTVEFLVSRGIPVCGHLGLQPQSVHRLGGYGCRPIPRIPRETWKAMRMPSRAQAIDLLVLELIPATVATSLTAQLRVPTIGIGAGAGCSGQVLVLYDMLGIYPKRTARFVRNFMKGLDRSKRPSAAYASASRTGAFVSRALGLTRR